jgi:hypothetical protein
MTWADDQIDFVDQRIRAAERRERAVGTVVSRDPSGSGSMVIHDGASTPTPAKMPGTVFAQEGDRVALELFGSDWLVISSYSAAAFGEANLAMDGLAGTEGPITTGSFVDMTQFGTFTFNKIFDNTFIRIGFCGSLYTNVATTKAAFACRFTPTSGGVGYSPSDVSLGMVSISDASNHTEHSHARRITSVPSGSYTVSLRWRRVSGTGTLTADIHDPYFLEVDERVRASVPIL